jgi:hypothetical protein
MYTTAALDTSVRSVDHRGGRELIRNSPREFAEGELLPENDLARRYEVTRFPREPVSIRGVIGDHVLPSSPLPDRLIWRCSNLG